LATPEEAQAPAPEQTQPTQATAPAKPAQPGLPSHWAPYYEPKEGEAVPEPVKEKPKWQEIYVTITDWTYRIFEGDLGLPEQAEYKIQQIERELSALADEIQITKEFPLAYKYRRLTNTPNIYVIKLSLYGTLDDVVERVNKIESVMQAVRHVSVSGTLNVSIAKDDSMETFDVATAPARVPLTTAVRQMLHKAVTQLGALYEESQISYVCPVEHKEFASPEMFIEHYNKQHAAELNQPYVCTRCGMEFPSREDLEYHKKTPGAAH
jgi:hypothetical protein